MRNNPEESIRNLSRAMRIQQYKTDAKSGIETQNFARNRSEIVQKSTPTPHHRIRNEHQVLKQQKKITGNVQKSIRPAAILIWAGETIF